MAAFAAPQPCDSVRLSLAAISLQAFSWTPSKLGQQLRAAWGCLCRLGHSCKRPGQTYRGCWLSGSSCLPKQQRLRRGLQSPRSCNGRTTHARWLLPHDSLTGSPSHCLQPTDEGRAMRECNFFATTAADGKVLFWDMHVGRGKRKVKRCGRQHQRHECLVITENASLHLPHGHGLRCFLAHQSSLCTTCASGSVSKSGNDAIQRSTLVHASLKHS